MLLHDLYNFNVTTAVDIYSITFAIFREKECSKIQGGHRNAHCMGIVSFTDQVYFPSYVTTPVVNSIYRTVGN